jgi:hypothetical protein
MASTGKSATQKTTPIVPSLLCSHRISYESGRVRQRRRAYWGDAYRHIYEKLARSGRSW